MGIYDREYYRDEETPGLRLRAPQSMVMTLILINVAVWVVTLFAENPRTGGNPLVYLLGADAYSLIRPWWWWQLLTAGFVHSPGDIFHIGGNMLGLFFLGRAIESMLGKWEFLRYYLAAVVLSSLAHAARLYLTVDSSDWHVPCIGASGAVTAVVLQFVFRRPHETLMLFPFPIQIRAWIIGVVIVVSDLFGAHGVYNPALDASTAASIAYDVHLAGAAFAAAYFWFGWNLGYLVPSRLANLSMNPARWFRRRPKLRVHHDEGELDPKLEREGDRILQKIADEGRQSLTPKEEKTLEKYSRQMREKHKT